MAFFIDEDEVWKCWKHPSKQRRSGICPICLCDRLITLCPDCANVRPCSCYTSTSSSSCSSFSSLSRFAISGDSAAAEQTGRFSNLMDVEPPFRRAISMSIPFLRSKSRFMEDDRHSDPDVVKYSPVTHQSRSWTSFWSFFKKSKNDGLLVDDRKKVEVEKEYEQVIGRPVVLRSRSMAVQDSSSVTGKSRTAAKGKGWYFPSPIKVFRQSKLSKIVQERSPVNRD